MLIKIIFISILISSNTLASIIPESMIKEDDIPTTPTTTSSSSMIETTTTNSFTTTLSPEEENEIYENNLNNDNDNNDNNQVTQLDNFIHNLNNGYSCGHRLIRKPKIINGTDSYHGNHPWMISLLLNNRHHCGGSLINSNWILTAAHCVFLADPRRFTVKLGGHLRNKDGEPTSIVIGDVKVVAHPGFSFATFAHDLALIRMPKKITFNRYIQPICLPDSFTERTIVNKAMVIGWGKIRQGGLSAEKLQEVELPIVDNLKCINWYREMGKMLTIRPSQICAGLEEGGKDACQGDSGSPMLITDQRRRRSTVVGIVSAGIGCALPKLPGIYTRVSSYLDWIQETMEKLDQEALKPTTTSSTTTTTTTPIPTITTTTTDIQTDPTMTTTTQQSLVDDNPIINTETPQQQLPPHQWIQDESVTNSWLPPSLPSSLPPLPSLPPPSSNEDFDDYDQPVTEHDNLLNIITSSCCH